MLVSAEKIKREWGEVCPVCRASYFRLNEGMFSDRNQENKYESISCDVCEYTTSNFALFVYNFTPITRYEYLAGLARAELAKIEERRAIEKEAADRAERERLTAELIVEGRRQAGEG